MAKLKLDLHDIYNKGGLIEKELNRIIEKKNKGSRDYSRERFGAIKKESIAFFRSETHQKKIPQNR